MFDELDSDLGISKVVHLREGKQKKKRMRRMLKGETIILSWKSCFNSDLTFRFPNTMILSVSIGDVLQHGLDLKRTSIPI